MMATNDGSLELRKVPPALRARLCEILASDDHWKTVMAAVPGSGSDKNGSCKYSTDHVNIIDNHCKKTGKLGMDVLIDEWGTSGKVRPTVEDLYLLCDQLQLYRAADFILDSLMGGIKPTKVLSDTDLEDVTVKGMVKEVVTERPVMEPTNGAGYVNINIAKDQQNPDLRDFKIPKNLDTDELNKQLDSLILDSQEQKSPVNEDLSLDSIALIQSPLPHFAFGFLRTITNNFCEIPYSAGGNKIGAGAFGSVYFGKLDGQLGLVNTGVAVKRIARDMVQNEEQFNNEVEIMGLVAHQHLLTLLAYSCDGEDLCLLYPYMENGSLEDRLAMRIKGKSPLTPMQRLKIAYGTGEGLQHLHSASHTKPLVHRDIKTANILLDANNEPKVGDFGLVRLGGGGGELRTSTVLTQTVVGTSAYMAPEAVRGEVTVKLDVFSFGVVLLELLTGLPAMDQDREVRDLVGHLEEVVEVTIY